MLFKSLLAGSALLAASGGALAERRSSSSKCSFKSVTTASSKSEAALTLIIKDIDAALCGEEKDAYKHAHAAARKTAHAYASAIADVSVDCYAYGNAEYKINGKSSAYAQGTALAKSFAAIYAKSEHCGRCESAGKVVVEAFKKIYVDATANLDPYFHGVASGPDTEAKDYVNLYTKAYEEVTLTAFVDTMMDARAADGECSSYVRATAGAVDGSGTGNVVTCSLNLEASRDYVVHDAMSTAIAEVGAKTCLGNIDVNKYTIEARSLAEAYALAVTEVSGKCFKEGEGYGCAMGEADIWSTAEAVASTYASGYGKAISECFGTCKVDYSAMTSALQKVIATAYSKIYFNHCANHNNHFDYSYTRKELVKATAPAIAKIMVEASAYAYGICDVVIEPETYVGPTHVEKIPGGHLPKYPTYPTDPKPYVPTKPYTAEPKPYIPKKPYTPKHRPSKGWRKGGHKPWGRKPWGRKPWGRRGGHKGGKVVRKVVKKINIRKRKFGGRRAFIRGKTVRKQTRRSKN